LLNDELYRATRPVEAIRVLRTRNLRKTFKVKKEELEVVKGVDIDVNKGEIFGLLGPNGAGKTTTLRMLTTLLPPTSGEATVAGVDLIRHPQAVRERIGYVSQAGGADPLVSAKENLVLQGRMYGMSASEASARADVLIVALEMTAFGARRAGSLSGGQRRRLDIALGMMNRPELLFLDEPTTGLDPQSRAHLWDEVRRLRDNGATVVLTTHYLDEADALCDRIMIMDEGTIVAEGTPDELKSQIGGDIIQIALPSGEWAEAAMALIEVDPTLRDVVREQETIRITAEQGDETLPRLLRQLESAGIHVQSVSLARPSLDDVFLKLTGRSLREAA
jgi:ABC-2 type transport system ATP-binding protein